MTDAGEYSFPSFPGGALVVVQAEAGAVGTTITLGYLTSGGAFAAMQDAAGVALTCIGGPTTEAWEVRVPPFGVLAAKVEGTGPHIANVNVSRCIQ